MDGTIRVDGTVSGAVSGTSNITGTLSETGNVSGTVTVPVFDNDTEWGEITGNIVRQEDLMNELHDRDNRAMTIQEIEKILYLD